MPKINIFEDFDYAQYETLLTEAKANKVQLVHNRTRTNKGGFTFAYQRAEDFPKCKMINVAVCYCSTKDYFARKIGAHNALANFFNGNFVQLPVGSEDSADIVARLRYVLDVQ